MGLRFLNEALYTLPIIGDIKFLRDLKTQNDKIDDYVAENPPFESLLQKHKIKSPLKTFLKEEGSICLFHAGGAVSSFFMHNLDIPLPIEIDWYIGAAFVSSVIGYVTRRKLDVSYNIEELGREKKFYGNDAELVVEMRHFNPFYRT